MKKVIEIYDEVERFPFSVDILTRSLTGAGLTLQQATNVALEVEKNIFKKKEKCSKEELTNIVTSILQRKISKKVANKYKNRKIEEIIVKGKRSTFPFSKGLLTNSISAAGVDHNDAYNVAREIENKLISEKKKQIGKAALRKLVYKKIKDVCGKNPAERYLVWRESKKIDKPIIILVGGATGSGKSTLSVELAHSLGISSVISTDIIREIMRTMFSEELMPFIHKSSYNANEAFTISTEEEGDPLVQAFIEQATQIKVGILGMIKRALTEKTDLIINGVHILPGLVDPQQFQEAIVEMILLYVPNKKLHKSYFTVRETSTKKRKASKYLHYFDNIRKIQDYIIKLAERYYTPVFGHEKFDDNAYAALCYITDTVQKALKENEKKNKKSTRVS